MSALSDAATFATDPAFRPILTAGLMKAAIDIYAEDDDIPDHARRVELAERIIGNPNNAQLIDTFAWAVATNPTVVGEWISGDQDAAANDLGFVLGSVWNALADVR